MSANDQEPAATPAAPSSPPPPRPVGLPLLLLLVLCAAPAWGVFEWFFCRIEVDQGTFAVLIAKTGRNLPSGEIIARDGEKGIQLAVLPEGRHFRNPFFWDWKICKTVDVAPGKVCVLVRKFGKEPESGRILVEGDPVSDLKNPEAVEKGILRTVLTQGRYRVNPFAYRYELHDAVEVKPGFVGVVTNLVGPTPKVRNVYTVEPGERGVPRATLGAGTHYLNPYVVKVNPIDVRVKRLEFSVEQGEIARAGGAAERQSLSDHVAVSFPSSDGFEIQVKLAVTWQIDPARAAEAFVRISTTGDVARYDDEVIHKILTPAMRGFARIEGSKFEANAYISGEQRSTFQHSLLDKVRTVCGTKGVLIHEVLVSDIEPPPEIAEPIRQREIAKEELARNKNQIKQAQADASLARQTELVKQERAKVEGETKKIQRVIGAKNAQEVGLIDQEKQLEVAKTDLSAAQAQASAIVSRGDAEAAVIQAQNEAESEPLRRSVEAFRSPQAFAAFSLAKRLAPGVRGVFADPSSPFGKLLSDMIEPAPSGAGRTTDKKGE